MRDKHITRLLQLAERCREYVHPLDLALSRCPPHERRHLLCYESGRELAWLRDYVHWMRTGSMMGQSYWQSDPTFGWTEWPRTPFLAIDESDRTRRIAAMKPPPDDPWLKALPLSRVGLLHNGPTVQIPLSLPLQCVSREELVEAFKALLEARQIGRTSRPLKAGRSAPRRRLEARITALVIYRLRKHFSAYDALALLEQSDLRNAYSDEAHLERARRKAERHLAEFDLRARAAIQAGRWFFP